MPGNFLNMHMFIDGRWILLYFGSTVLILFNNIPFPSTQFLQKLANLFSDRYIRINSDRIFTPQNVSDSKTELIWFEINQVTSVRINGVVHASQFL